MKTMLIAVLASAGVCQAQNLLVNGDLEAPAEPGNTADGWTLIEPDVDSMGMAVDSASFQSFQNHTPGGDRSLWLRSFMGGLSGGEPFSVNATLTQTVAGQAGVAYTLSAWFYFEAFYSGLDPATPTDTLLRLEFLDAGMGTLVSLETDVDSDLSPTSVWGQHFVNGIAPAGTAFVRVSGVMVDGVLSPQNPQSAFVDDFVLVPSPGGLALLGLGVLAAVRRRPSGR